MCCLMQHARGPRDFLKCTETKSKQIADVARGTCAQVLEPLLPPGRPPPEDSGEEYTAWREQLQQALVCALDEVQATFACTGHTAGTTVTIIIQVRADPTAQHSCSRFTVALLHDWAV